MTTPMGCMFCRWWEQERNPLRREWGTCTLANQPKGAFQVLLVMNSTWDEENEVILTTRDNFYCAEFSRAEIRK
jgi:hypothetical protein